LSDLAHNAFFFTELDPRAKVKGSRDPLGTQPVWGALGRTLVGNLTTVTTSVRGFTTLLIGLHLAQRAAAERGAASLESVFIVWEQIAAYAQHAFLGTTALLGSRRVVARARAGTATLSPHPEGQILGNQKAYGLWGLYTTAARASGLVATGTPPRLTPVAERFVQSHYLPKLATAWGPEARDLVRLIQKERSVLEVTKNNKRLATVAGVLQPELDKAEVQLYRDHLVAGGPIDRTEGRQERLAALMAAHSSETAPLSRDLVSTLADDAEAAKSPDIATQLRRIAAAESVLAPAAHLFAHLLTREGASLAHVASDVASQWGHRLDSVDPSASQALLPFSDGQGRWAEVAETLSAGSYRDALELLLRRNADAMTARGGTAPWATQVGGHLRIRFQGDPESLPDGPTVRRVWRHPYFLPSLRHVISETRQTA
jgi:hypothetical protein